MCFEEGVFSLATVIVVGAIGLGIGWFRWGNGACNDKSHHWPGGFYTIESHRRSQ